MVLGVWFESARAMFFLFILLNALPVPMLRQVSEDLVVCWVAAGLAGVWLAGLLMAGCWLLAGRMMRRRGSKDV